MEGRLLFVAYTMRDERIRIISARGAKPYEQRRYTEENRWAATSFQSCSLFFETLSAETMSWTHCGASGGKLISACTRSVSRVNDHVSAIVRSVISVRCR